MEKKKRGFAAMSLEKRRAIARRGGVSAHAKGTARQWDEASGAEAGRKGAAARWPAKKAAAPE